MARVVVLIALLLCLRGDKQGELQSLNVSGVQCQHIAKRVRPWDVETDAKRYVDSCVHWNGIVGTIIDADVDETKAWVIPIEGKFAYCGSPLLTISFHGATGTDMLSSYQTFLPCDFLCAHYPSGIQRGDPVSFTGKILGVSRKADPTQKTRSIERVLIGITEIHKIDWEREVQLPRSWR